MRYIKAYLKAFIVFVSIMGAMFLLHYVYEGSSEAIYLLYLCFLGAGAGPGSLLIREGMGK